MYVASLTSFGYLLLLHSLSNSSFLILKINTRHQQNKKIIIT